jgi:hypothetical protein
VKVYIYLNEKETNFSFQVVEKNNDIRELPPSFGILKF